MVKFQRSPQLIDKCIGEKLRFRRKNLGITQKALADSSGVTFQQIQKYEKGLNRIGVSRLCSFCKILRVNPSYFFEDVEYNQKVPSASKVAEKPNNYEGLLLLIQSYNKIVSPEIKELILKLVVSYAEKESIN